MCGIAGLVTRRGATDDELRSIGIAMRRPLHHRGPDDAGAWWDAAAGIMLAHTRLSILDLSSHGSQPMSSASNRYVLVFNGEIYNFRELRADLERLGHTFKGHSDTEVVLASVVAWGIRLALERFNGMFAFALWDREQRVLHLARDRLGEEPLYYGRVGGHILFASELKALRAVGLAPQVNRSALTEYLRAGYVSGIESIYDGVFRVAPGHLVEIDAATLDVTSVPYWSLEEIARRSRTSRRRSDEEALSETRRLLEESVALRMVADVPVGAFLSGGIDSSLVVALMQKQAPGRVKTYSIGFCDAAYDESKHALEVARRLGTDHEPLTVTGEDALGVVPDLAHIYDEPFADASQIPTSLLCRFARGGVKVALSGDGGDEIFSGYRRYTAVPRIWGAVSRVPRSLRLRGADGLERVAPHQWDRLGRLTRGLGIPVNTQFATRLPKAARLLRAGSEADAYRTVTAAWHSPERLVVDAPTPAPFSDDRRPSLDSWVDAMMLEDARSYLPDGILVKLDRASMAVSLECRVPLLDHRVVEHSWELAPSQKVRGGQGKWILRRLLEDHVPPAMFERPKQGFGVPMGAWLRGPLKDWAGDLLSPDRLNREGFLRSDVLTQCFEEHQAGLADRSGELWTVLMFQSWLEAAHRPPSISAPVS